MWLLLFLVSGQLLQVPSSRAQDARGTAPAQGEPAAGPGAAASEALPLFDILGFEIDGSTLLHVDKVKEAVKDFVGSGKTVQDVEKARDALEKYYHDVGYPTVLVNIPEQMVEGGVIRLEVIESRIGRVKVTGNRYYTMEHILGSLPSLKPGEIIHGPSVQEDITRLNRNRDIKVKPSLSPGRDPGTVDVELVVEDRRPIHGGVEINNRSTHDTTELRLNASVSYDNLWQRQHSVSFQYQSAPLDTSEVQVFAGSYALPAPWNKDHHMVLYGVWSDSDTAFGEGFRTVGKGSIVGGRYIMPLPPYKAYGHSLNIGFDYKDFEEVQGFSNPSEPGVNSPVTYFPLSVSYSASLRDPLGTTFFSGGLNMVFRGLVTDQGEFEEKRFKARGNYLYGTFGVERTQTLPGHMALFLKADGQIADQPLINNEQFAAGGMESVRGYRETEVLGDWGIHATVELHGPDITRWSDLAKDKWVCVPFLFYDFASLRILEPLPEQNAFFELQGAGFGVRGSLFKRVEYNTSVGFAFLDTERTEAGDSLFHFQVKYTF